MQAEVLVVLAVSGAKGAAAAADLGLAADLE